jgi:NAD(P)-dependent dehydrogenase (short-subunit alcohol dehydrogenase family)
MASELGANVWAAGRSEGHIATAKEVSGGSFEVRQADTHDAEALDAIFKEVGQIHHLVSAAVGGERTLLPFLQQTQEQFQAAYDKLWGYCKVVRVGAPYLEDDGAITLVSGSPCTQAGSGAISLELCWRLGGKPGALPGTGIGTDQSQRGFARDHRYSNV